MLSYQHGFHAGNFADVQKHTALCLALKHYAALPGIVTYFDSHSGRGLYDLSGDQAQKTGEWRDGVAVIQKAELKSEGLTLYKDAVSQFENQTYPGSPALIRAQMADNHHSVFFELHPTEYAELSQNFAEDKRLRIVNENAMEAMVNYLPARKSNAFVLIDPPYEIKDEYDTIGRFAKSVTKRCPNAMVMVWYPILPEARHETLKANLRGATFYELCGPQKERGMFGSGLAVFNAPDGFHEAFTEAETEIKAILFG